MTAEPSALQGEGSSKMSAQRIFSLGPLSFPAGESFTFPGGQLGSFGQIGLLPPGVGYSVFSKKHILSLPPKQASFLKSIMPLFWSVKIQAHL